MSTDQRLPPNIDSLIIDTRTREINIGGKLLDLSDTESLVLSQLVEKRNQLVLREEILPWKRKSESGFRHPVENVIVKLRACIGPSVQIELVRGRGYRLTTSLRVEKRGTQTATLVETLKEIAGDRMKMHTRIAMHASLRHYKEILRNFGPNEEAYREIAKIYLNLGHTGFCDMLPQVSIPLLRENVEEALEHFHDMPAAYAYRGLAYLIYDFDWKRAYEDLNHALALNPDLAWAHCFISHLDVASGQFDKGLEHARRGAKLDPTTPMTVFTVPFMLVFAGRADEAVREAAHCVDIFDPFPIGNILHGYALEAVGATQRAIAEYKRCLEAEFFPDALARLGHAHATLGERKIALGYRNHRHTRVV